MVPRNQTINKVPERLVLAYCRTSFCHIHRHKAASRGRQELADLSQSILVNHSVSEILNLFLNMQDQVQSFKSNLLCYKFANNGC